MKKETLIQHSDDWWCGETYADSANEWMKKRQLNLRDVCSVHPRLWNGNSPKRVIT